MPEVKRYLNGFSLFGPVLMLGGLIMAIRLPQAITKPIAFAMLFIGLLYMGCFEFIREAGRRPYIIRDHMYSTSILKADMSKVKENGLLKEAKWISNRIITKDNKLEAGREVFNILCLPCHSVGGPLNDIRKLTRNYTPKGLEAKISNINSFSPYMPPFAGNTGERNALAYYIAYGLNNRSDKTEDISIRTIPDDQIPAFDMEKSEYVLLAWSEKGMQSVTDASRSWMILPPGVTLNAQLIERGETPDVIVDGVTITYEIEDIFANPAERVDFWNNAGLLYNREIPENTGLTGNGLSGIMEAEEEWFTATLLPVFPYTVDKSYMPYPLFTLTARNSDNEVIATTKVVAPSATEIACQYCHGGQWRVDGRAGISELTAEHVLATHDRISGTDLQGLVENGMPVLCNRCHGDNSQNAEGNSEQLNLSAAMHGFHAAFMAGRGAAFCVLCHPAESGGATRAYRGMHRSLGLDCTYCHGEIEDHAISLLNSELNNGKARAAELLKNIRSSRFTSSEDIVPRQPWINEPDCLNCHVDFQVPEDDTTFNQWTSGEENLYRNRTDESGRLRCAACHGSPHAIYPAENPYNSNRDALQPLQYQDEPYPIGSNMNCKVCHTIDMEEEMHHENMLREFRNQ